MVELWLKFKDPSGNEQRVAVDKERFTVGRHSENDLPIADGRLSREHVVIERFGDVFVITDRGSSNGTELNGERISEPVSLKHGDKLSLGGMDMELELTSDTPASATPAIDTAAGTDARASEASTGMVVREDSGIPKAAYIIAPIFMLLILLGLGTALFLGGGNKPSPENSNLFDSRDFDDPPKGRKNKESNSAGQSGDPTDIGRTSTYSGNTNTSPISNSVAAEPGVAKTEANGSAFLRKIAQNDPRAFLIGEPANAVYSRIKSLSSSPALASNITSARKNAAQIKSLAISKNLKPDLLAVAAIAKLGNSAGDILQTAQLMANPLDRLSTQLSNELGEECLVIIAAYDQGAAGDYMKMRNQLQDLATKMPDLVRDIRTIWFLRKQGKITDAEYDFAVRFLAIGAIAQNPHDFGVNAESLSF